MTRRASMIRRFLTPAVWAMCFVVVSCSGSPGSKKCFTVEGGETVVVTQTDQAGTAGTYTYTDANGSVETGTVTGNGQSGSARATQPAGNTYEVTSTEHGQNWACHQQNTTLKLTEVECP